MVHTVARTNRSKWWRTPKCRQERRPRSSRNPWMAVPPTATTTAATPTAVTAVRARFRRLQAMGEWVCYSHSQLRIYPMRGRHRQIGMKGGSGTFTAKRGQLRLWRCHARHSPRRATDHCTALIKLLISATLWPSRRVECTCGQEDNRRDTPPFDKLKSNAIIKNQCWSVL